MSEEYTNHEFDFWIGNWDLTWGENDRGTNRIELHHGRRGHSGEF